MAVENREITCYEYINALRDIEKYTGQGIYGLDKIRASLHTKLCEQFLLTKGSTKKITDNIDLKNDRCAENLYLALLEMTRSPRH